MARTFGTKIANGYILLVAFTLVLAIVAVISLRSVVVDKDDVIERNARLVMDQHALAAELESEIAMARGFLWLADQRYRDGAIGKRSAVERRLDELRSRTTTSQSRRLIDDFARDHTTYTTVIDRLFEQRKAGVTAEQLAATFEAEATPARSRMEATQAAMERAELDRLTVAEQDATDAAGLAIGIIIAAAIVAVLVAILSAFLLTRGLARQLGAAVQQVQSSSTQLSAATTEHAAGAREQIAATQEVTTTLKELSATSRQMSESAQRVVRIAGDTGTTARQGDAVVVRAQRAIGDISTQVNHVVKHMVDLGKKTQQVGGVLELINELSEQTNILAINATIESAGAGEAGRRFAVVAEEIRRLADRVSSSTKEIRALVEDIRSATNATVMVTEDGAKAVDLGTRQFSEVTMAFSQIAAMIETTSDAAREIELGAKQQVSAVDQVTVALQGMTQAVRDAEASTKQTVETAQQLDGLSRNLLTLIRQNARDAART